MNTLFYKKIADLLLTVCIIGVVVSMVLSSLSVVNSELIHHSDFLSYYSGAKLLLRGLGESLYNVQTQTSFQKEYINVSKSLLPYKNPPILALLFFPFALFPLSVSYILFFAFSMVSVFFLAKLLGKISGQHIKIVLCGVMLFLPVVISALVGQVSILLSILWFNLFRYIKEGKFWIVGVLSALVIVKPQYAVLAPFLFLLSKDKSSFLRGFVSSLFILFVLSIGLVGLEGLLRYPKFLSETESLFYGSDVYSMMTLTSFLHYAGLIFDLSKRAIFFVNAFVYLLFLSLFYGVHKKNSLENNFSVATLFTLPLAMHVWEHDLVLILLPIFFLLGYVLRKDSKNKKLAFVLLLCLYFCWILRFVFFPFLISFILLFVGVVLLIKKDLNLKQVF